MSSKVTHFPGHAERRERANRRRYRVPCRVSERWLQFPETAHPLKEGDFMVIDVMTLGMDERERKLCELVLTKQDLVYMINQVETKVE